MREYITIAGVLGMVAGWLSTVWFAPIVQTNTILDRPICSVILGGIVFALAAYAIKQGKLS